MNNINNVKWNKHTYELIEAPRLVLLQRIEGVELRVFRFNAQDVNNSGNEMVFTVVLDGNTKMIAKDPLNKFNNRNYVDINGAEFSIRDALYFSGVEFICDENSIVVYPKFTEYDCECTSCGSRELYWNSSIATKHRFVEFFKAKCEECLSVIDIKNEEYDENDVPF